MSETDAFAMPTSFAQKGLWLTQQMDPSNPFYVVPMSLRLRGRLDRTALERALSGMVARHESLRTRFVERDGEILAVIDQAPHIPLTTVDLTGLPAGQRESERARISTREASTAFDLARGPLVRHTLLLLGPEEHQLLIVSHHIITDAWSQDVYFRELSRMYEDWAAGGPPRLPEPGIQYADFAVWQQEQARDGGFDDDLDYWRRKLDGVSVTALPPDATALPGGEAEHRGAAHGFTIPASAVAALRELAEHEQATLYMALLAVCSTVFARSSGQYDVSVAGPIAGRTRVELDQVIGFFVNTLVLRTDLSGDPTFRECLRRVRTTCLEAYDHQDLPFDRLVEELAPVRDLAHNPFFRIMVVLQNAPADDISLGPLEIDYDLVRNDTAKFDLNVVLMEAGDGSVHCTLEYDTALFTARTMARLAQRMQTAVTGAATAADTAIGDLPVTGPQEELLREEWETGPVTPAAPASTLHGCFEDAADRHPDRTAVSDGSRTLTYAELDRRANQVAHRLLGLGLPAETPVGVCTRRDVDLLVALYGVLKAGLAYLPLDPDYPADRLRLMLAGGGATAVVAHEEYRAALPGGLTVIGLDGDDGEWDAVPQTRPAVPVHPAQLCYVIYTSGSTGIPKGAANEHRAVVNLMAWGRHLFSGAELSRFSATCSTSFDLSVMELFIPLSYGGSLLVARNALELTGAAGGGPVHVLHTVPSIAAELLRGGGLPESLETVVLAGEPLSAELTRQLRDRVPGLRVINVYGVTEAACSSTYTFPDPGRPVHTMAPIGTPVHGVRLHVLDADLRPVPVGAPGELYLGGSGTARCYAGNPGLSAERFVPDPFDTAPGARMYRTGDVVYWNSRGELEYRGRGDSQVKLRGIRIELGELEAAARSCEAIGRAVAVVTTGPRGQTLVCYVTADDGRQADDDAVLAEIAERVPRHLVPSRLVVLDRFPLNPNGKVDRVALAALEPQTGAADRDSGPSGSRAAAPVPRDGTEARIAEVWGRVLDVERVGRHDNFFDLGGHSLLLLRVRAEVNSLLGLDLPVVDFFRYPSVAAMARHLRAPEAAGAAARETAAPRSPAVRTGGATARPRLTEGAGRSGDIAVVGMQCRVPGADSVEEFWGNLLEGRESISTFTPGQLRAAGVSAEEFGHADYVPRGGVLGGVEDFDAEYFGLSPREAELLDPQQRLLLELAVEALQRAGHDPGRFPGAIGVYAGVGFGDYLWNNLMPNAGRLAETGGFQVALSVDKDYAATRVAYKLDLRGPAVTVQSACSTSLVAVHLAVQALLNGETDLALAGGSALMLPARGYLFREGGIASPDGHCRPFDAESAGTVPGSGAGLVVLRRLEDALADGDTVHAVIKGTAVNNDGSAKVGYTAPGIEGQASVIRAGLRAAGADPDSIGYIETHGTATALGDPIELAALSEVFATPGARAGSCALGSVKSNVGHLDAAAGVTGLIKTILTVQHATIPATLHYTRPNPHTDLDATPFYIPTAPTPWPATTTPRRAGTSSFGMGGTNAHIVIEQAPPTPPPTPAPDQPHILTLSAKTPQALDDTTTRLAHHLTTHPHLPLPHIAHTLQTGHPHHPHRRIIIATTTPHATTLLTQALQAGDGRSHVDDTRDQAGVTLHFGPGTPETVRPAARLAEGVPAFRRHLTAACDQLPPRTAGAVRDALAQALDTPHLPWTTALVVQYALAGALADLGIRPAAVLGTGAGSLLAAATSGVMSPADAFSVALAADRAAPGARAAAVREALAATALTAPGLPLLSGSGGVPVDERMATDREFWAAETEGELPHGFGRALRLELDGPVVDLSPDAVLGPIATETAGTGEDGSDPVLVAFAPFPEHDSAGPRLTEVLGRLWLAGVEVDWAAAHGPAERRRVILPTYPFQRKRHWVQAPDRASVQSPAASAAASRSGAMERRADRSRWIYSTGWARTPWRAAPPGAATGSWLIVTDPTGPGQDLAAELRSRGHLVVTAEPGTTFTQLGSLHYAFDLRSPQDADHLVSTVRDALGAFPAHVVHALCAVSTALPDARDRALHSVLFLAGALLRGRLTTAVRYTVLTTGAVAVAGEPELIPEHAMASGAARVIPQEIPGVRTRLIDVEPPLAPGSGPRLAARLSDELAAEPEGGGSDVAYRGDDRWVQRHLPADPAAVGPELLRDGGVYLLVGGLGVVGRSLAGHLARARGARLALVHRRPLPPRSQWDAVLRDEPGSPAADRVAAVRQLEREGAEVLTLTADLTDAAAMGEVIGEVTGHFGALHGIFHCAGTVTDGPALPLDGLDPEVCDAHVRSKTEGVRVLAQVTEGLALDFVLLSSSLSPVLGGLGLSVYAAGNAHLDLFAHRQRRRTGTAWSTVNWEGWRPLPGTGTGESTGTGEVPDDAAMGRSLADLALLPEDGGPLLDRLLRGRPAVQTVVSTADLDSRLAHWVGSDWEAEVRVEDASQNHERPDLRTPYLAPRDDTERRVAGLWQRLLGIEPVGVHDSFFELGGSSLLAIRLVTGIQREFGVTVPLHATVEANTVERLAELVTGESGTTHAEAVTVPLHTAQSDPEAVFFWIHPLGGTVLCYRELAAHLGERTSSYGLQAPMLFEGVDAYTEIDSLAERYTREILAVQPDGPYRLGGWSAGGIIAVSVARRLAEAGKQVRYVGVIEAEAPRQDAPVTLEAHELLGALLNRQDLRAADLPAPAGLLDGSPEQRYAAAVRWIGAGRVVPADQVERIARLFLVETRILRIAAPREPVAYKGTLHVYPAGRERAGAWDATLGWSEWAAEVRSCSVPGTHQTVLHEPHVRRLAAAVRAAALD